LSDFTYFMCAFTPLIYIFKMSMMDCTVLFMHVRSCWAKADWWQSLYLLLKRCCKNITMNNSWLVEIQYPKWSRKGICAH
jgi:hypothetical protein